MTTDIQRLHTNARMSQIVIANGIVHLAGQVPDIDHASITEQTNNILARIDRLLAEAGVDNTRLISANIGCCRSCSGTGATRIRPGTRPSRAPMRR
ncbi:Rid family hydrolase [Ralstonia syzygii]|uniref:Rid family hydrolase n=1 Tax=Ralstonia syzygii TaxID=28097 RepID=UPI001E5F5C88|nr:Rid family hydrolase [Ralstonia syzygii]CAH0447214.1 hypothetical protein LMG10661_03279 [Ralstonia syzygii subsp. syzygii]